MPARAAPADRRPVRSIESRSSAFHVALACIGLLLGGCTTIPRLAAPQVAVSAVRVDRMSAGQAEFTIMLALVNRNDVAVAVDAIDAEVTIENVAVGTAQLAQPVQLPARGEATAAITARGGLAPALRAAAEVARRAQAEGGTLSGVRYRVTGTAVVDGGRIIPFARSGEIPWPRSGALAP
jgi:LEA14-like dessication related protein